MTVIRSIWAYELEPGMQLPDFEDGYVTEVTQNSSWSLREGADYPFVLPDSTVFVAFHDARGNENYLFLQSDLTLTVTENL